MARDLKIIQRGVNVQANDLVVPPGTPLRAQNIDFQRDGVAARRAGFDAFYTGLPWSPLDPVNPAITIDPPSTVDTEAAIYEVEALPHVRGMYELWARDRSMLVHGGFVFAYDPELEARWRCVPVVLSHRFTLFGTDEPVASDLNVRSASGLGRSVRLSRSSQDGSVTSPLSYQAALPIDSVTGAVGNAMSDMIIGSPTAVARFKNPRDTAPWEDGSVRRFTVLSDGQTIRHANDGSLVAGSLTVSGNTNATGAAATFYNATWMTTLAGSGDDVLVVDSPAGGSSDDGTLQHMRSGTLIRSVAVETGIVSAFVGSITAGTVNGTGAAALFEQIAGLTRINSTIYAVQFNSGIIRQISQAGVVTTLATVGATCFGLEAVGGALYTMHQGTSNSQIKKITTGGVVSAYCGNTDLDVVYEDLVSGSFSEAAFPAGSLIRGAYTPYGSTTTYLVVECPSLSQTDTMDIALVPVTSTTAEQTVHHIVRCPLNFPDGTAQNKLDSWGPNVMSLATARGVDAGAGVVFSSSDRPFAIDTWSAIQIDQVMPPLRPMGIMRPEAPSMTAVSGTTFAAGLAVAYRVVCGLDLPSGRISLGPPSERIILIGSTTATWSGSITAYPSPGLSYGGIPFLQLYRTRSLSSITDPGDQMFLCYETPIAYGSSIPITDQLPDDLLGAELYTNTSEDGVAATALPPPCFADDVTAFSNSVGTANFIRHSSVVFKVLGTSGLTAGSSTVSPRPTVVTRSAITLRML